MIDKNTSQLLWLQTQARHIFGLLFLTKQRISETGFHGVLLC
ncbi:hypothetical protein NC653_025129 [Populus alba x Populus x berolinensis]|uniref:Uncharacterized protein n=1 Tax=Populus alba x Populus x berolinensis TaxID=444605 RepID=A0AAD6MAI5_9ROSI|nr:hypothetical protein NC653_025129 [Populus alba x Populus x berolinensis]